jgi:hypothetical protein
MVQECLNEILTAVLVIKIICMLPDIARKKRDLPVRDWRICVGCLDYLQSISLLYQPGPSAPELGHCRIAERRFEGTKLPNEAVINFASLPVGAPSPLGFILFQKNVWFHTCAALLKRPANLFAGLLYRAFCR